MVSIESDDVDTIPGSRYEFARSFALPTLPLRVISHFC